MKLKNFKKYNIPKLNEEVESLNTVLKAGEIEAVLNNSCHRKTLDWMMSQENVTKDLRKR